MEGLGSPKTILNLNIKSKGPNHTTTYLPYLSHYLLTISKTFYSSLSLKQKYN